MLAEALAFLLALTHVAKICLLILWFGLGKPQSRREFGPRVKREFLSFLPSGNECHTKAGAGSVLVTVWSAARLQGVAGSRDKSVQRTWPWVEPRSDLLARTRIGQQLPAPCCRSQLTTSAAALLGGVCEDSCHRLGAEARLTG